MLHAIHVTHYYYAGTLNTPSDGLVRDEMSDEVLTFSTHDDAAAWIEKNIGTSCGDNCWSSDGRYYTSNGEYARPTYSIRRLPRKGQP